MFKSKKAHIGSKGGRPKKESQADEDVEESRRERERQRQAANRNQVSHNYKYAGYYTFMFSKETHLINSILPLILFALFWTTFLCKILTIRRPPQDQDLSAIQALKWLAVLAAHLQLQGLAAHLYPPLAHRRQAGGHELPAVCQTNGETKFGGAYWHKTKQIRCGKIEEVELNLNCPTRK